MAVPPEFNYLVNAGSQHRDRQASEGNEEAGYSPEPWELIKGKKMNILASKATRQAVANFGTSGDAKRALACVNSLSNVPDPDQFILSAIQCAELLQVSGDSDRVTDQLDEETYRDIEIVLAAKGER